MSAKELRRVEILGRVAAGAVSLTSAATLLAVSYRHAKRLWRRYQTEGASGLAHRNVGRPSPRARPATERARIVTLVRTKYGGDVETRFGPTLAAEHLLSEDGLTIDHETLRRWMLADGLWSRARRRAPYRQRRPRKAHFGELLQLDGSFEAWLEDRGPDGCLMDLVDDATGRTELYFAAQETTWAAVAVLRRWVEQYGVPHALYTDWKNVYVRTPTEEERATGAAPLTQFGRMCAALGIQIIAASSPQAKGRVERQHGTHQDRLIKKLRRAGVTEYEAANAFLRTGYVAEHNRRFARSAASPEDFHHRVPTKGALDRVFQLEEPRTLSNDWVVRYRNRWFQLERQSAHAPARSTVIVGEDAAGAITIRYRNRIVRWHEIVAPAPRQPAVPRGAPRAAPARTATRFRPGPDHPWKQDAGTIFADVARSMRAAR